jgi:septal ring factor EnvC (AmiA/AmiB activator)
MKRYVLGAMAVAFLLAGPVGCGKKEIEELKTKVTQLEQQLGGKDNELTELRAKVADSQAQNEATTLQLVQVKAERDKLKKEVAALKKRRAR